MERVKAAAQDIQDEAQRRAQNSQMLLYCITASVTPQVMDRLALKEPSLHTSSKRKVCSRRCMHVKSTH